MINVTHEGPVVHGSVGHRPLALTAPHTGPRQLLGEVKPARKRTSKAQAKAIVRERSRRLRGKASK
jgi:hypothetical protein